jgi:CBS domain-containing membrane protein
MTARNPQLVRDLMTTEVMTVRRNQSLKSADDVMRLGRFRHLPVLDDDGTLAGIVTQRDLFHGGLLRALGYGSFARDKALDALLVKESMKTEVLTTTADAPLSQAAALMLERKVGCLVVVEGAKVVGILTEADFVRLGLAQG